MPEYHQKVTLVKEVTIHAKNAKDANSQMRDLVYDVEFASGFDSEATFDFEDEDVECPDCKGDGVLDINDVPDTSCPRCGGQGYIPFTGE